MYLVLTCLIMKSLGFLLVLFAFVVNRLNREHIAKRSKKGQKTETRHCAIAPWHCRQPSALCRPPSKRLATKACRRPGDKLSVGGRLAVGKTLGCRRFPL